MLTRDSFLKNELLPVLDNILNMAIVSWNFIANCLACKCIDWFVEETIDDKVRLIEDFNDKDSK